MTYSQKSLDLSTYAGQKIYIAFVMEQSGGDGWDIDDVSLINETTANSQSDSLALVALYNQCNGPGWTKKARWLTGKLNTWQGVTVENGRVVELELGDWTSSVGLTGPLPAEISNLTELRSIILYKNQLTGTLPGNWSALTHLTRVDLDYNQITGSVPDSWQALVNLHGLGLSHNQISVLPDLTVVLLAAGTCWRGSESVQTSG